MNNFFKINLRNKNQQKIPQKKTKSKWLGLN